MFRLIHQDRIIGASKLESGDPSIGCVSGELVESGTTKELSEWIVSKGGVEEDGAFLLEIDSNYLVVLGEHTPIPFAEGSIICVPEEDEVYLELVGIPKPEYAHFFPAHIESFDEEGTLDS